MKEILKSGISTILGLILIAFGVYDLWLSPKSVFGLDWTEIAKLVVIFGVGLVLIFSPDKFITEFFNQFRFFRQKANRSGAESDSDKPEKQ